MQQTKILQPFHDVSLTDQHWNHDDRFYLSSCPYPCPYLCFCLCVYVCASYAPYPYLYPCLYASYASFPFLCSHFLIFLQLLELLSPPIRGKQRMSKI